MRVGFLFSYSFHFMQTQIIEKNKLIVFYFMYGGFYTFIANSSLCLRDSVVINPG